MAIGAGCGGGSDDAASQSPAPTNARVDATNRWSVVGPPTQGVDATALAKADQEARTRLTNITSLLVARNGRLVLERYYHGATPGYRAPVYSITKTVTSALVGIALGRGALPDLDRPVIEVLPEVEPLALDDARRITLRHLLTMSAGWVVAGGESLAGGEDVFEAPDPAAAPFAARCSRSPASASATTALPRTSCPSFWRARPGCRRLCSRAASYFVRSASTGRGGRRT